VRRAIALSCLAAACASVAPRPPIPASGAEAASDGSAAAPARADTADEPTAAAAVSDKRVADFFGEGYPPAREPATHGRIGSLTWGTWIQPAPKGGSLPLGNIPPGQSVPITSDEKLPANGKCPGFVQVAGGYVCNGPRATLDMDSPWMRAGVWTTPAPGVMPYQFALSVGAPMLTKPLPPEEMHWKVGPRDIPRMKGWNEGHDELAVDDPIQPNGPIPDFLKDGGETPTAWGKPQGVYKKMIPKGSMLAFTRAFEAYGQTWVLSTDMSVVPASGLKRFRVSDFHGVELGKGVELPIAWIRKEPRAKWRKTEGGFEQTGETWPVKTYVALTGNEEREKGVRFLETREPGIYMERTGAALVEKRAKPPWETKGTGKWIHVRVLRGTLTLYDGPNPVFSTLMSPGKGEATPYGRYFVESKHHYSTMTTEEGEPRKFWIADVPWTVYFKRPYAIHAAYWHEDFGQHKSGGCVNLSPVDAKRVFDWVEPPLPEGWQSAQGLGPHGTFVLVEG
jgi:hypothetical protein